MRKALLTWALKDRNVWENTFLGKASVFFPGGLFLCAGCSSSNALFSVSLLNTVSRYNCSVTLWALKWTWVMMEVDKKYSSTVGPGGGVGFSLSLWCFTHFIWGLQCAVPEIPWGKTRPVPALRGVSFPRLKLGYPPPQVGSGLLLSVTAAFVCFTSDHSSQPGVGGGRVHSLELGGAGLQVGADPRVGMEMSVPARQAVTLGASSATAFAVCFLISARTSQFSEITGK